MKNLTEKLVFCFIFLFGLIWIFLVPPLQKADESTHYLRTISLSRGEFVCQMGFEKDAFEIQEKYYNFTKKLKLDEIAGNYSKKTSLKEIFSIKSSDYVGEDITLMKNFCSLPFFPYLIFVLPVLAGNLFDCLLLGFFLSRIVGFLLFFFSIYWSYRKIQYSRFRWVLLFFALTPMVLHQVSSIGYDSLSLSLIPIIFSLNIDFFNKEKVKKKDFILYVFLILLFLLSKPGYYFVSLVYFLIPPHKIVKDKKKYVITTIIVFFSYILFSVLSAKAYMSVEGTVITPSLSEVLAFLDLKKILLIIKNTFTGNIGRYITTFIGEFGWLDYGFIGPLYYMYFFFSAILLIYVSKGKIYKEYRKRILIVTFIMIVSSIALLFGGFYYSYFYQSSMSVIGIQGRYFLVFFPYIFLFLVTVGDLFFKHRKLRILLFLFILLVVLIEMFYIIYLRYYKVSTIKLDHTAKSLISYTLTRKKETINFKRIKQ